jgi:hypothetical protein
VHIASLLLLLLQKRPCCCTAQHMCAEPQHCISSVTDGGTGLC